jgi:hypothetical protein
VSNPNRTEILVIQFLRGVGPNPLVTGLSMGSEWSDSRAGGGTIAARPASRLRRNRFSIHALVGIGESTFRGESEACKR